MRPPCTFRKWTNAIKVNRERNGIYHTKKEKYEWTYQGGINTRDSFPILDKQPLLKKDTHRHLHKGTQEQYIHPTFHVHAAFLFPLSYLFSAGRKKRKKKRRNDASNTPARTRFCAHFAERGCASVCVYCSVSVLLFVGVAEKGFFFFFFCLELSESGEGVGG